MLYSIGLFIYYFCQWLTTVVIVRLSGYAEAGVFSITIAFTNIFGFLALFGMRSYQVCDVHRVYSDSEYAVSRIVTTAAALVLFTAAIAVSGYDKRTVMCCGAYMAFKCLEAFTDVFTATLQRDARYDHIAVTYALKGIAPLTAFTVCLLFQQGLFTAICAQTGVYMLTILFYDLPALRGNWGGGLTLKRLRPMLAACFPLMLVNILASITTYLPKETVQRILGDDAAGYFGTLAMIIVVFSTLATSVWGACIPRIANMVMECDFKGLNRFLKKVGCGYLAVSVLFCVLGRLLGPLAFRVVYGGEIMRYMELLLPMLVNAMLLMGVSFFVGLFVALKRHGVLLLSYVVAAAVCWGTVDPLVTRVGMAGGNISMLLGYGSQLVLLVVMAAVFLYRLERNRMGAEME